MKKYLSWVERWGRKRVISTVSIVIGVGLIIFAKGSMNKVAGAKSTTNHLSDFFTNSNGMWNPMVRFFGGKINAEISKYDTILAILLIVGIVLVIAGIAGLFWRRRR